MRALDIVRREGDGASIGDRGLDVAAGATKEIGARRVEEVVSIEGRGEPRLVEQAEAVFGRLRHRGGDGTVECDDRRRPEAEQLAIEDGTEAPK